ncbi:unnamed protein product [Eretmochelys imbricata]
MLCLDHCEKVEGISPRDFGGLFALVLTYISSLLPTTQGFVIYPETLSITPVLLHIYTTLIIVVSEHALCFHQIGTGSQKELDSLSPEKALLLLLLTREQPPWNTRTWGSQPCPLL